MERWSNKVALVTGASAGIGAAISTELVKYGVVVIGFARRLDRLKELQSKLAKEKGKFVPIQGDISVEQSIKDAFKQIKADYGGVDILINNSGIVLKSTLTDGDTDVWKKVFDVNVIGLCIATREAVRSMKERNVDGHIIHINSLAGHRVSSVANLNVYSASKYAVTSLTETLRLELHQQNRKIKTTSISPGLVDTDMKGVVQSFGKLQSAFDIKPLDPIDVANAAIYALSTPPHALVTEIKIRPIEQGI